jgi:hypothetical protein
MPCLPATPFVLHGGCFCTAITYTISVPALPLRPPIPRPPINSIGPLTETTKHFPIISFDHCTSCRRISGTILESWFICPQSWVQFSLEPRPSAARSSSDRITPPTLEYTQTTNDLLASTYVSYFSSSEDVHRTFCGRCGTHLSYRYSGPEEGVEGEYPFLDIPLGTLDRESLESEGVRPARHGWWDDGVEWVRRLVTEGDSSLL